MNELIYNPLAMNSTTENNMTSNLIQMILVQDDMKLMPKIKFDTRIEDFNSAILKNFQQGIEKTKEKGWFKSVTENWTNILKDFHVFWNSLRNSNRIDKVGKVTKDVLRKILQRYSVKENYYYQMTRQLVKKIREGYQKFIIGHQALKMMQENGLEIVSEQIQKVFSDFLTQE